MRKNENIARFSADKIRRKIARGESKTDWKRVDAMSQAEVERLADKDEGPLSADWGSAVMVGLPRASAIPVSSAPAYPRRRSAITRAPRAYAVSQVPSVDGPSVTTIA